MKSLIHLLLISSLSIIIARRNQLPSKSEMDVIVEADQSNITGSTEANLKLLKDGEINIRDFSIVWKGTYNDATEVAIKIIYDEEDFEKEVKILDRLNATQDPDVEKYRIPRIYYHGPILDDYFAIAMTLFDETVSDRLKQEKGNFSDSTVLLIFKQAVEALQYIHSKNVLHHDIYLRNIFIRGEDIFIADFDSSHLDVCEMFLDDYESLLFWTWKMAAVPGSKIAKKDFEDILTYFKDTDVQEAFRFIVNIGYIDRGNYFQPNYDKIIRAADAALTKICDRSEPVQFNWLKKRKNPPTGESSKRRKNSD